MPQVHSLFVALKRELKSNGLTYISVANHLGLTEASVKRMFSREDISLKHLDNICKVSLIKKMNFYASCPVCIHP